MKPRPIPATSQSLRASGDRWLFGYADIVTLLFACFAALYATQVSQAKPAAAKVAEAAPVVAVDPLAADVANLVERQKDVALDVRSGEGGVVISLEEAGSFALGRADLSPAAQRVIRELADLVRDRTVHVRIEGHTDDRPIRSAAFASNWELSTARATRVVQFLIEEGRLVPTRLSAAGYGEYRPRVNAHTPEARARNRRVDIVLLDATQEAAVRADYVVGQAARLAGER